MGIAENLRKTAAEVHILDCERLPSLVGKKCLDFDDCGDCTRTVFNAIADAIGEEKREAIVRAVGASIVHNACGKLEPQLPEGIEWPRFEDGELVKFGDEVYIPERDKTGKVEKVYLYGENFVIQIRDGEDWFCSLYESYGTPVKRSEPEVLDADGVPIKVGDTVWYEDCEGKMVERTVERFERISGYPKIKVYFTNKNWMPPNELTHRKSDTQEAIDADAEKDPCDYFGMMGKTCGSCDVFEKFNNGYISDVCYSEQTKDLLRRQRKLMGGE